MPDKFCACVLVYMFVTGMFQCEQLEGEMVGYLQLQRSHLHRAMDVLHTYATIISQVSGADRPIVVGQIDNIYIQLKLSIHW